VLFAVGLQALAAGVLVASDDVARAATFVLVAVALAAAAGVAETLRRVVARRRTA
jgi:hypothetical protein